MYTVPNNYLFIDLKNKYFIKGMKIRGTSTSGYPWSKHPPSYELGFSIDNMTFYTLFQETQSRRINDTSIYAEYCFETTVFFRYFRLTETSLVDNHREHGHYISWLDFYVITNFCTLYPNQYAKIHLFLLFFNILV